MAAPVVSGVGALLRAAEPSLTPSQIAARLEATAVDLGAPGKDIYFGAGRVSAARALLADALVVTPTQLTLSAQSGSTSSGVVTITNRINGTVRWQARSGADWLKVSGSSVAGGQLAAGSSTQVTVTADHQLRPAGVVMGIIQIGALLGEQMISPRMVQVAVDATSPPPTSPTPTPTLTPPVSPSSRVYLPVVRRQATGG